MKNKAIWIFSGALVIVAGIIGFVVYKATNTLAASANTAAAAQGSALGKSLVDSTVGAIFGGQQAA